MNWWHNWKQKRADEAGYKFRQERRRKGLDTLGLSKVADKIWIGGLCDVLDTQQVYKNDIQYVLNVCRMKTHILNVVNFWRPLNDNHGNTYEQFSMAVDPLNKLYGTGNNFVVHCVSGINRSVSVVIAFLAVKNKTTFEEELAKIKVVRPFVNPTPENTALAKEYIEKHK